MKDIDVYLQYPFSYSDSPYYKNLREGLPKNINFVNVENQKGVIIHQKKFKFLDNTKRVIKYFLNHLAIPLPHAYFTKSKKSFDLIHCAHCLSLNRNFPWVADIEFESQMWGGAVYSNMRRIAVKNFLSAKNCKKIMPWMEWTKENILKYFPEIEDKLEVVYPAIPELKIKKKAHKGIHLIFSGRYFIAKGGLHSLEVFDRLTKKYDFVTASIIGAVPKDILQKYSKNKKIKFYELIPQNKLFKIFSVSDVFVYPGYSDSFGFGFLEAMGLGLPIVTVDNMGRKEVVTDDVGFVIDHVHGRDYHEDRLDLKLIKEIEEKVELLINDIRLRNKMSSAGIKVIKEGRFSIKERNKKLKKIYSEALK